ncbi:MAG: prolipoprotein diacylglyceryl transferase [Elusimicrobia bacterium]|nr:prolipoprotein diacylglyceryl transferase [Elusimicrobiota bacterium]
MTFPVEVPAGPWRLHPHLALESLAYAVGFRLYLSQRRPERLTDSQNHSVIAGAIAGAAIGSKVLAWLYDPAALWAHRSDPSYWLGGKTIVGGLLGGLIGVEWTKKGSGVTVSTGDDLTVPLAVGMAIGRVGCFLTGLSDNTEGLPTRLPWGVDFGDGIPRHPAALYECAFLLIVAAALGRRRPAVEGDRFKAFMVLYLAWRLLVDFGKPYPRPFLGLGAIQVAALLGLAYYARDAVRMLTAPRPVAAR